MPAAEHPKSNTHKLILIVLAVIFCLLMSGVVFGYSALKKDMLIPSGMYNETCKANEPCPEQELKFNLLFTVASSAANVAALPIGYTLDHFGPRVAGAVGSVLFFIGCIGMWLSHQLGVDLYVAAYALLGVGGPFIFIATLHFSALFPRRSGLIISFLTGAFDTSSLIFVFFGWAYQISGGTWSYWMFGAYGVVPVCALLFSLFLMPDNSYERIEDDEEGEDDVDNEDDADKDATPFSTASAFSFMSQLSFLGQVKTLAFAYLCAFMCLAMLRLNFYMETVQKQLEDIEKDSSSAISFFTLMLPLGGVASIPPTAYILDNYSMGTAFLIIYVLMLAFGSLSIIPFLSVQYVAITIFVVMRPLIYSAANDFCLKSFGINTFGKVYGLLMLLSGVFNLLQYLLKYLATSAIGYFYVNIMLTALCGLVMLAFPAYVLYRERLVTRIRLL